MRALLALGLSLLAVAALPASASACDANWPTFEQVLEGSEEIVLGRVTRALSTDDDEYPDAYVIEVERVLKGRARDTITVEQRAYLCGDGLSSDDLGLRILIATDVRFYTQTLSPYWWQFRAGRVEGWAETPTGVTSLDELADRFTARLPDTATHAPTAPLASDAASLLAAAGAAALLFFLLRPIRRRPAAGPGAG